jgi:hypothetical protein
MDKDHFDQIAQEILQQKQRMDKLEAENRELRLQIADLNSGRGIFVDLCGIRFALRGDSPPAQTPPTSTSATPIPLTTALPYTQQLVDAPTGDMPNIPSQSQEQSTKEQVSPSHTDAHKDLTSTGSTFLEEMMIDEFASAAGSPNAVWQDPAAKKQSQQPRKPQVPTNEEQKAALRRELMGSFLLE